MRSKYVEEQLASPVSLGIQIRGNSQCYNLPLERSTAPGGTVLYSLPPHQLVELTGGSYFIDIRAGIFKKFMGARNQGGTGLSYRPARLHRLAEFIP